MVFPNLTSHQANEQPAAAECSQCLRFQLELDECKSQLNDFLGEEDRKRVELEFADVLIRAGERVSNETFSTFNPDIFPNDSPERAHQRAKLIRRLPPGWLLA